MDLDPDFVPIRILHLQKKFDPDPDKRTRNRNTVCKDRVALSDWWEQLGELTNGRKSVSESSREGEGCSFAKFKSFVKIFCAHLFSHVGLR